KENMSVLGSTAILTAVVITETDLDTIVETVRNGGGVDLSGYRRGGVRRRVAARMAKMGFDDASTYAEHLRTNASERTGLIDAVAINVSGFFRDSLVYELIADRLLPEIVERKRSTSRELRIWSAGCAAGEEPYTVAILVDLALEQQEGSWRSYIFATDIDGEALAQAHRGEYGRESLSETKLGIVERYFDDRGGRYVLDPRIRAKVLFSHDDLTHPEISAPVDSVFGDFDLVLCRNVLIYLARGLQEATLGKLVRSLAPGGYLVLGMAEELDQGSQSLVTVVDGRARVYQRR
ncbi:MAG: protein-glutamate O-methyltransferase CheR, partial [Myxococcota bacterium]